jgi:hypothetical protein
MGMAVGLATVSGLFAVCVKPAGSGLSRYEFRVSENEQNVGAWFEEADDPNAPGVGQA